MWNEKKEQETVPKKTPMNILIESLAFSVVVSQSIIIDNTAYIHSSCCNYVSNWQNISARIKIVT